MKYRPILNRLKWYEWLMAAIMILIAGYVMVSAFMDADSTDNPVWLTVVNFISAVAGVFCIFLTAKAVIRNFVFSIVNTVSYMIYLFYWHIWGTFALECFVYLPIAIVSWILWIKHKDTQDKEICKSKRLSKLSVAVIGITVAVSGMIYSYILDMMGDPVPMLDAYTVAIGMIAISLEMLRYREQYVLWLITDVIAVAMFIVHFDPVYLTKKTIYLIMAFIGLYNWIQLSRRNTENE